MLQILIPILGIKRKGKDKHTPDSFAEYTVSLHLPVWHFEAQTSGIFNVSHVHSVQIQ